MGKTIASTNVSPSGGDNEIHDSKFGLSREQLVALTAEHSGRPKVLEKRLTLESVSDCEEEPSDSSFGLSSEQIKSFSQKRIPVETLDTPQEENCHKPRCL